MRRALGLAALLAAVVMAACGSDSGDSGGRPVVVATTTQIADFARAGLREAVLDVASDNPRALHVYESAGMTPRHLVSVFEKPVG